MEPKRCWATAVQGSQSVTGLPQSKAAKALPGYRSPRQPKRYRATVVQGSQSVTGLPQSKAAKALPGYRSPRQPERYWATAVQGSAPLSGRNVRHVDQNDCHSETNTRVWVFMCELSTLFFAYSSSHLRQMRRVRSLSRASSVSSSISCPVPISLAILPQFKCPWQTQGSKSLSVACHRK
jgi:hypothetical protein